MEKICNSISLSKVNIDTFATILDFSVLSATLQVTFLSNHSALNEFIENLIR